MAWKFNSMIAEVGDFVHAVIEDRPPRIDPQDALYAVKAAEAVARSIETKSFVAL